MKLRIAAGARIPRVDQCNEFYSSPRAMLPARRIGFLARWQV
jgi:hypothetical protein